MGRLSASQRVHLVRALALLISANLISSVVNIVQFIYWRNVVGLNPLMIRSFIGAEMLVDGLTGMSGWYLLQALGGSRGSRTRGVLRAALAAAAIGCMIAGVMNGLQWIAYHALPSIFVLRQVTTTVWTLTFPSRYAVVMLVFVFLARQPRGAVSWVGGCGAGAVAAIYGVLLLLSVQLSLLHVCGPTMIPNLSAALIRLVGDHAEALAWTQDVLSASVLIAAGTGLRELRATRALMSGSNVCDVEVERPG